MPLDLSRIQALCYDVDGTLRDTDDRYAQRFERLLHYVRWALPGRDPARAARWLVMRLEGPANLVYGFPDKLHLDDELVALSDWLHRRGLLKPHPTDYLIIPGAPETLHTLGQTYPQAVISARPARGTHSFLDGTNLTPHFAAIASAQTTPRTKPKPAPVIWAANQMNVSPDACLMIGDTTVDIKAGKAAGAQTVGVLSGFGEADELQRAGADLLLNSVADLPEALTPS